MVTSVGSQASAELPARRVVVLGASNVTRGIGTVIETACHAWGRPLDILVAAGHGRSYGMRSRVLVRELPGIIQCALWTALAARPPAETAALITDIGNDLFYGAAPETIVGWVDECCQRLQTAGARLVMTRLPVCNVGRVRPWQFAFFRTLSYPGCRLSLDAMTRRAHELDEQLLALARRYDCRVIEPQDCWYGLDPVHVKLSQARSAWRQILAGWSEALDNGVPRLPLGRLAYLYLRAPERRWLFGRERHKPQPCGRLPDGTVLSFY